jgi:hypothetical protein
MPAKYRYLVSEGLLGSQSAWAHLGPGVADFGNATVAATTGVNSVVALALPDTTNLGVVGANDPYPSPLAAASTTRVAGASSAPAGALVRGWVYSANSAGTGIYNQAATFTVQVTIISGSSSATVGIATNLLAAGFAINGLTTQWNLLTFQAAPTERACTLTGAIQATNPYLLFWGDTVVATASNTAGTGVTVAPNKLAVVLEFA